MFVVSAGSVGGAYGRFVLGDLGLRASPARYRDPVEKLQERFGSPVAALKTLVWLCWVSFLVSIGPGLVYLVAWGAQTVLP